MLFLRDIIKRREKELNLLESENSEETKVYKMQAIKNKISDMNAVRKAKAEAKAEEKTEKELAKARVDIAHEVRLAKEAEVTMDLHVEKAKERAEKELAKHGQHERADGGSTARYDYNGGCGGGPNTNPTTMGTESIDATGVPLPQGAGAPLTNQMS